MADQLCTLPAVKLRLDVTDATDDTYLTELIEDVTDWIQGFTRRRLIPETAATYYVDTSSGSEISIPRGVRAVTSLLISSSDQPDTGGTYGSTDYASLVVLRPSSLYRRPGWPATKILIRGSSPVLSYAINGAKIVGDFDFAATPPAIAALAADAVAAAFTDKAGGSEVIGAEDTAITPWDAYFDKSTPQYRTLLRYRIGSMGIA